MKKLQLNLMCTCVLVFLLQVEAINGTVDFIPKWFLDDVANVG